MINLSAIGNAVRVGSSALDKRSWLTKATAYATFTGLLMAIVPFIPTEYAQYLNQDFINSIGTVVITIAGAVGVFGASDKVGLLPAKPAPISEPASNGQDDVQAGG